MSGDQRNVRIHHRFTLKSPLSHIGEVISTIAYLAQEPILQTDGSIEEVFSYSGNAWRGQLRDLGATYMLEALGSPQISLDAFHLLYAGGSIGGTQRTNIAQARQHRQMIPLIAILGGGVGNQILPGKIRVSNFYPLCAESPRVDPFTGKRGDTSYREMTFEKSYTRKDDSKDPRLNALPEPQDTGNGQMALDAGDEPTPPEREAPSTQMRTSIELVAPGVKLAGHIDCLGVSDVELGCLVSAMHTFSRSPHIGGKVGTGHGHVLLETQIVDLDTGEVSDFLDVDETCMLSQRATEAKDAYDQHLRSLYDAMLADNEADIRSMIGAGA